VPGDPLAEDTFEAKSFIEIEAALAKESLDCTIHREPKEILIITAVAECLVVFLAQAPNSAS